MLLWSTSKVLQLLLIQWQQQKHQKNVWNLFKVNNKDNRSTWLASFWCLYNFTRFSSISIVDFEQVTAGLVCKLSGGLHIIFRETKKKKTIARQAYSEPSRTSEMEIFSKMVNCWKPLTVFEESAILDVWLGLECFPPRNKKEQCIKIDLINFMHFISDQI